MSKPQHTDEVMRELWAVKDATVAEFQTVGAYLAHLRRLERGARKAESSSKARESISRRQAAIGK